MTLLCKTACDVSLHMHRDAFSCLQRGRALERPRTWSGFTESFQIQIWAEVFRC